MAIKIIGLGAGGHARVVIEILRLDNRYELAGLLDKKPELKGEVVLGVPVLGDDGLLQELVCRGVNHFFVGFGSVGDVSQRRRLFELARGHGMVPVKAIHPQSIISPSTKLGPGVTVMAGVVVNACAVLGVNVIVNTGAIVEHDCVLGDHVHVASGACLASTVHVGSGAHIGAGASVLQCITIGEDAVVGAGSVVVKDVPSRSVVAGVPAKVIKKLRIG
ncbi:MAG: acetyltransferase [Planctomycetota bacterium]|jgi:UDP-perosamine 4-acetyltransferase